MMEAIKGASSSPAVMPGSNPAPISTSTMPLHPINPSTELALFPFGSLFRAHTPHSQSLYSGAWSPSRAYSGASLGNDAAVGDLLSHFHHSFARNHGHRRSFLSLVRLRSSPVPVKPSRTPRTSSSDPQYTPRPPHLFIFVFRALECHFSEL
jgi:hypothetical protein